MRVYLGVYVARIGFFGASRSEVWWRNMKKNVVNLIVVWFLAYRQTGDVQKHLPTGVSKKEI
jgi:hypothetical protein